MSDHPFEPPREPPSEPLPASGGTRVLLIWAACGACIGASLGLTLQLVRGLAGGTAIFGIAGVLVGGLTGAVALQIERRQAASRPAVLGPAGNRSRPLHGLLFVLPAMAAVPFTLWFGVIGSVAAEELVPAFAFGMLALALTWGALRAWGRHQLTRALQALELGQAMEARRQLEALEGNVFATWGARLSARINLGALALEEGRLDDAARWFASVRTGAWSGYAAAGLALVHVLQGRLEPAEEALRAALASSTARAVQAQIDAARLLLVLRQEGEDAARALGEQLLDDQAAGLFRAVLAALRHKAGDLSGAADLEVQVPERTLLTARRFLRAQGMHAEHPEAGKRA